MVPLLLAAALAAAWGVQSLRANAVSADYPPPGEWFTVEGRKLYLDCRGERRPSQPLVVLEAGGGDFSPTWETVQAEIASFARVCRYDRAGYGWSERGPQPRSADQMAGELRALLQAAGDPPPYLLVAHSYGGHVARVFAARDPAESAGLVLVDVTDEQTRFMAEISTLVAVDARWQALRAGLGLLREQPYPDAPPLRPAHYLTFADELAVAGLSNEQVRQANPSISGLPLVVMVAGVDPNNPDGPAYAQALRLSQLSPGSRLIIAEDSSHAVQRDRPDLIVQAVRGLLER
jgi:pimeloyl-ACP methyl ester carboxylesterase